MRTHSPGKDAAKLARGEAQYQSICLCEDGFSRLFRARSAAQKFQLQAARKLGHPSLPIARRL
jgi:hypothetical protein